MGFTRASGSRVEGLDAQQIEAEIAALSARIDVATHRMLVLVHRFDESGEWARQGHRSCAAWLSWRTGLGPASAREHVRVAGALAGLPKVDAALARGDISFSKVRAITRVATPEREATLLRLARFATAQQLERICRGVRQVERNAHGGDAHEATSAPDRFVVSRNMPDGTVEVVARLQPDEARAVIQAIDRVRKMRAAEQVPSGEVPPKAESVSAETFRRLACDAALIPHLEDESGRTVDVGRRTRTIPAASSTRTTSPTGSTAAKPSSTTSSTSAASTTASSTKTASPSPWTRKAAPSSAPRTATPSFQPPRAPASAETPTPTSSTTSAAAPASPSPPASASPNGKATAPTTTGASLRS